MNYDLSFPHAWTGTRFKGVYKATPEDFYVEELFAPELIGQGEHLWLYVEKDGQNTEYVARQIAKFASVRDFDVGFSGLKDRQAVTRQWFSIYFGSKPEPDWNLFALEGVHMLKKERHTHKLRRGSHKGNRFRILVKGIENVSALEQPLDAIKNRGFPNYFGVQRFGRDGANLSRGERYFLGQIKASKSQRGFYLSAARSFLFNLCLAEAVKVGSWLESGNAGPLFGDAQKEVLALSEKEAELIDRYPVFRDGLNKNRLKLERRPYCIVPENFSWESYADTLSLSFDLPAGVFATALLDECLECLEVREDRG